MLGDVVIAFKWEGFIKISAEMLTATSGLACRLASWLELVLPSRHPYLRTVSCGLATA